MDKDNRCPFYMGGDRCFASVGDEIRPEDMFGQREFRKCKPDAWTLVRCQQEAKRQEAAKDFYHPDFVPRPPQDGEKGDAIFKRRVTLGNGTYLYDEIANERTGKPDRRVNEQPGE